MTKNTSNTTEASTSGAIIGLEYSSPLIKLALFSPAPAVNPLMDDIFHTRPTSMLEIQVMYMKFIKKHNGDPNKALAPIIDDVFSKTGLSDFVKGDNPQVNVAISILINAAPDLFTRANLELLKDLLDNNHGLGKSMPALLGMFWICNNGLLNQENFESITKHSKFHLERFASILNDTDPVFYDETGKDLSTVISPKRIFDLAMTSPKGYKQEKLSLDQCRQDIASAIKEYGNEHGRYIDMHRGM